MKTVRRSAPPRCPHTAKPQPPAGGTDPQATTASQEQTELKKLEELQLKAQVQEWVKSADCSRTASIVGPDAVEALLREEPVTKDEARALLALLPRDVPKWVIVIPAGGTFFVGEFCDLTEMLTVRFPSCDGDAPPCWDDAFTGHHAATHLFLRLKGLLEPGKQVEFKVVGARSGEAPRSCCRNACAVNWCSRCVAAWALKEDAAAANPKK